MIVAYHLQNKITEIVTADNQKIEFDAAGTLADTLVKLAVAYPDQKIVWCHSTYKESLNIKQIDILFHHNKMMLSFRPAANNYFEDAIGYVEESLFISVNKKVTYPTWQMSSFVGVIHASVLNAIGDTIVCDPDFDYYLSSLAKLCMPLGLLCYSEPQLLKSVEIIDLPATASSFTLFRFVKQHYKTRWIFLLLLNLMIYEKKFPILSFLRCVSFKNRKSAVFSLDGIAVQSSRKVVDAGTVDVIIPTIGRKEYLYDVLRDFSKQTFLPQKIIIVEQNPEAFSKSDLDYIQSEKWPFQIEHFFIHQSGACNARNLALQQTNSEWVFLADDDIRIGEDFIQKILNNIEKFGVKAVSSCCLQEKESPTIQSVFQWGSFGSGCSFVNGLLLKNCTFNLGYEFGYGEDSDFGMQLRNQGCDVLYLPHPEILHLKAPIGGFRTKPVLRWHLDKIQPKPSPTVMLYLISHNTKQQILGYKTILFFKYYKHQNTRNPFKYFRYFKKQWRQSVYWANQLKRDL